MRRLISLAVALAPLAVGAQEAVLDEDPGPMSDSDMALLVKADDVSDAEIYTLAEGYDEAFWASGEDFGPVLSNLQSIGEVEDVMLDRDGRVVGVTVDVGGFLGIGEKEVLLPLNDIRLVAEDDDDLMIVTRLTEEQLEAQDDVGGVFGD
ncbi:ribonucleotide-diphosphate reductase alpha subunit [Oceanicola granulosus HTCC2516]|uniref:Ribonucleotide-diphosphate reductase alpha subunit n=1 Tax=Oceanicola granulosus (strain ATCC BAA-861 / DSM 15982 / KCTC 12143 / HTCC2516) TaxID=314256 RepID=Q2CG60_OCEGH|nr:PRC-barrel domain-containing protein [Oceanicola granulosus]EAR51669.1 ribonucleotide-diphosphate reductase alpha subunit [Oceanicola granulosus HTCC2516]